MHEAAHGLLHPNRKVNNFLGQWLTGSAAGSLLLLGGIQATLSAMLRPPGLLRSSGTSRVVHCASIGLP